MASIISMLFNATAKYFSMEGILVFLVVLVLVKYLSDVRPKNFPPGPFPLPLIGNTLNIDIRNPVGSFSK
ncbi:hypothetical protein MHYP_G00088140, partial [Metynnis hypsauchen]